MTKARRRKISLLRESRLSAGTVTDSTDFKAPGIAQTRAESLTVLDHETNQRR